MHRDLLSSLLAASILAAMATPSSAGYVDFLVGSAPAGSLIIQPGSPIAGGNISVIAALGEGTNANDGVASQIASGLLSFTTGAFLNADAHGNRFYEAGGSVVITGTFDGFTGTLLSGSFVGPNPVELQNLGSGSFRLLGGEISGTLAPALASFYDFNSTIGGGFSLLAGGRGATPTVNSGNIAMETEGVFGPSAAVPEPSSLALCGVAGLAGLGYAPRAGRLTPRGLPTDSPGHRALVRGPGGHGPGGGAILISNLIIIPNK